MIATLADQTATHDFRCTLLSEPGPRFSVTGEEDEETLPVALLDIASATSYPKLPAPAGEGEVAITGYSPVVRYTSFKKLAAFGSAAAAALFEFRFGMEALEVEAALSTSSPSPSVFEIARQRCASFCDMPARDDDSSSACNAFDVRFDGAGNIVCQGFAKDSYAAVVALNLGEAWRK